MPPTATFHSRPGPTSSPSSTPSPSRPLPLVLSLAPPPPPSHIETHRLPVAGFTVSTVDVHPAASRSRLCGLHALPDMAALHALLARPRCCSFALLAPLRLLPRHLRLLRNLRLRLRQLHILIRSEDAGSPAPPNYRLGQRI